MSTIREGAVLVIALACLAGCGASTARVGQTSTPSSTAPQNPTIAPTEVPTPTPDLTGPVGTIYTYTSSTEHYEYEVKLSTVTDPAPAADTQPLSGTHFVSLHFNIVGISGIDNRDDAAAEAKLTGSDHNPYNVVFDGTKDCASNYSAANFQPAYAFSTTPGATATPCVVFQVLNGVSVSTVTWGIVGTMATWTVNG